MMRFKAEGLIPIVVAALAVALTPPRASAINDLSLNVAPASLTAMPGDPVTVTLDVANLPQAINGFQVLLRYDPALLRLDSIVPTDLGLAPPNAGWVEVHFSEVFGDVTYAATINGGQIVLNHTAATLNFTALAEGVTSVVFRLDSPPFFTKLTAGVDNTTILPNKFDSSLITLSCDDGLFCNGAETFSAGLCQPGTDPCDDGVVCTDDTCNEALDTCTSSANDANCDDALFCNGAETCDPVNDCQAGLNPCDDAVGCTFDVCDELTDTCTSTPIDANCDDGQFCNGAETCDPVNDCQPATDPCNDGVGCTSDLCDEFNDTCLNTPDDAACDDLLFCTGIETCDPLLDCQPGTPPDCADTVVCTDDACDELNDVCTNTANNANCDDGLFCNGAETCDPVNDCQLGTDPCDDGVVCTDDACDELLDTCSNTANDANCDDLLFCNGAETCDPVNDCQLGTDPCNDGVVCTDDACDELLDTCSNTANDANCDDLLFCNGAETCDPVNDCQSGTDPCNDGVVCTDDACDELLDTCSNTANDANCTDGLFCNGAETCDPVNDCQSGTDPCNDGVVCTDDACDELLDTCSNTANDANCDDGLFCTGTETCDPLLDCQAGTAPTCDDAVVCTDDACDALLDACTNTPNNANCADALFCNGAEVCDPVLDCLVGTDPCAPLACDETADACFAALNVAGLELFYSGRFLQCRGGVTPGTTCTSDLDCTGGRCAEQADPSPEFLTVGSTATMVNMVNHIHGITGVRVVFSQPVTFATTPDAAVTLEWTTGTGVLFSPVTAAAGDVTMTAIDEGGVTVLRIELVNDLVRQRWLKVTIDAAQVSAAGVSLDGELTGNPVILPSGDGVPGGNAVFFIGNAAGDVDGNRKTEILDVALIRQVVNPFLLVPITDTFDMDHDGKLLLTDVAKARLVVNPFFTVPFIAP